MRRSPLIFTISLIVFWVNSIHVYGQILDTLYYNEVWQLVNRDSAKQFRVAEIDTINLWFTGKFQDFYADSSLLMEGQYSKSGLKNGPFKIYYPGGQPYCVGFFDNDQLAGNWQYYTKQGSLKERVSFTGFDFIVLESYDAEGKRRINNGTGKWTKEFVADDGSRIKASGHYYGKKREGLWQLKNQKGQTIMVESYSNDYFLQGTIFLPDVSYYDESNFTSELFYPNSLRVIESFTVWDAKLADYPYLTWLPSASDSTLSTEVNISQPDQQAQYPLGLEVFQRKVSQQLVYPEEARGRKIEGKVYVEFIVGTDGYLYDTRVLRGIGGGCDQQAVIAILKAGRWFPAQKRGLPIEQRVVIPVSFRLTR